MSRNTYVLRSNPGELTFIDKFLDALDLINEKYGMEFEYALFEEGASDLARHVYLETQERAILSLCEDFAVPARYLMVEAATQQEVDHLGEWLKNLLPFIPLEELQQEAREKINDDPQVLVRMALGTYQLADPISLEILREGLRSDNVLVRFRAAAATSFTEWIDFLPDLIPITENDPSPEVREMAIKAVEACQRRVQAKETS